MFEGRSCESEMLAGGETLGETQALICKGVYFSAILHVLAKFWNSLSLKYLLRNANLDTFLMHFPSENTSKAAPVLDGLT